MTSNPPDGQVPGASAPAVCKRPGCGNPLPAQDRGRTRQFCSTDCARRYHNDARIPAPAAVPPSADSPADPLVLDGAQDSDGWGVAAALGMPMGGGG
jgi:hypothetical protein